MRSFYWNSLNIQHSISIETSHFFIKNAISRRNRDEILSEFREHAQKCPNSSKIPEILQIFKKNPWNFRNLSRNSIDNFMNSIQSLVAPVEVRERVDVGRVHREHLLLRRVRDPSYLNRTRLNYSRRERQNIVIRFGIWTDRFAIFSFFSAILNEFERFCTDPWDSQ